MRRWSCRRPLCYHRYYRRRSLFRRRCWFRFDRVGQVVGGRDEALLTGTDEKKQREAAMETWRCMGGLIAVVRNGCVPEARGICSKHTW